MLGYLRCSYVLLKFYRKIKIRYVRANLYINAFRRTPLKSGVMNSLFITLRVI